MAKQINKQAHFGLWGNGKCVGHQTFPYGSRQELLGIARGLQWMLEHQYNNAHVTFSANDEQDGPHFFMNSSRTRSLKNCKENY